MWGFGVVFLVCLVLLVLKKSRVFFTAVLAANLFFPFPMGFLDPLS